MTTPIRLAAFAAALAALFGVGVAAGTAFGPERDVADHDADPGHARQETGHGGGHGAQGADVDAVRGLTAAADGMAIELGSRRLPRGRETELAFRIVDADGRAVRDYEVEHEKRMHVILVRRDTAGFQHLHPRLGDDGAWRVPVTIPDAGSYRVFADFNAGGESRTLAADLAVAGQGQTLPLPAPAATSRTSSGYEVALSGDARAGRATRLDFTITRDGQAVETEPYLGAAGHLVALREGDLAFLHVHPSESHADDSHDHAEETSAPVAFDTTLPSAARYRLFLQFKHDGQVHTAAFTLDAH